MTGRWLLALALPLLAAPVDEPALSLADLDAYRAALARRPDPTAPAVRFRDLWDRPGDFAGRPVLVEGRVARLFRQPRVGEFPPLTEAWIVSEAGDPTCLVFPTAEGGPAPEVGAPVRFSGTFLRRVRYRGGDAPRLAPLVVGPEPPRGEVPAAGSPSWSTVDWALGLGAASMVALILARRHLDRPRGRPEPIGPPPEFLDGQAHGGPPDEAPE